MKEYNLFEPHSFKKPSSVENPYKKIQAQLDALARDFLANHGIHGRTYVATIFHPELGSVQVRCDARGINQLLFLPSSPVSTELQDAMNQQLKAHPDGSITVKPVKLSNVASQTDYHIFFNPNDSPPGTADDNPRSKPILLTKKGPIKLVR